MAYLKITAIVAFLFAGFYVLTGNTGNAVSFWLMASWVNLTGVAIVREIRKSKP